MTNLGSGGEAKASPADRDAAETDLGQSSATGGVPSGEGDDVDVDQTERGATMDTAMAANMDPDLMDSTGERSSPSGGAGSITVDDSLIGTASPQLGQGQTAAYGETAENAPAPSANEKRPS